MLKLLIGCVTSLVILFTFAYAPPAYAASANLVLTQIQAGGTGAALQELIVIYNNSTEEVDISDWCIQNKSGLSFACLQADDPTQVLILPAMSSATIASTAFDDMSSINDFTTVYAQTNQSSGAIVGGNDNISLVNQAGEIIDNHSWTTSLLGGMLYARNHSPETPLTYFDTDSVGDWTVKSPSFVPEDQTIQRPRVVEEIPILPIRVTEMLPNASGSDTGNEFIELYNPNDQSINLNGYQLWYGPLLDKMVAFPEGAIIDPTSYKAFTNAELGYTLLNSSSRVRLLAADAQFVDETPAYEDPGDDVVWALIDELWQYSDRPTPGEANAGSLPGTSGVAKSEDGPAPCAANQYRSPETNRCRLIATASSTTQTPCKDGQYRSEETNRCRNIATATDGPAPCKEGQERNPETNRCRNIVAMSNADYKVLGAQTSSGGGSWYMWAAIGGLLLLAIAYAVWEWRQELAKLFIRVKGLVRPEK